MTVGANIINDAFPTTIGPRSRMGMIDRSDWAIFVRDLEHENRLGRIPKLV